MTNERPINMKRSLKKRGSRPPALQLDLNNNSEKVLITPTNININSNRRSSLALQQMTEIVKDKLYLGNESDANNYELIKNTGITSIITLNSTVLNDDVNKLISDRNGSWKHVPIRDRSSEQIIDIMEILIDFIDSQGKVLVHCQHGISRSSTIVMAYLMKTRNMTNLEAFDLVKAKRPIVDPNFGFLTQLQRFEEVLNSPSKVELPYSPEIIEERPKMGENSTANNGNKCPIDIARPFDSIFKTFTWDF